MSATLLKRPCQNFFAMKFVKNFRAAIRVKPRGVFSNQSNIYDGALFAKIFNGFSEKLT